MTDTTWKKGTKGRVRTPHKCDGTYCARAVLVHDSPPDQEQITVRLIDDFYCLEAGDEIQTQRYLFKPTR